MMAAIEARHYFGRADRNTEYRKEDPVTRPVLGLYPALLAVKLIIKTCRRILEFTHHLAAADFPIGTLEDHDKIITAYMTQKIQVGIDFLAQ